MMTDLTPGFADPVRDAQACFRAVLDAMSRPGHAHRVLGVSAPAPLCDAAASVLLTLVDHETRLWLDPEAGAARDWLTFHTGAPLGALSDAMFAMAMTLPDFRSLCDGTNEMPETSATVVLQVRSLTSGRRFVLAGPGLRVPFELRVDGLPADFISVWERNHKLFPRGIDLILCSGDQVAALPRSVTVKEG